MPDNKLFIRPLKKVFLLLIIGCFLYSCSNSPTSTGSGSNSFNSKKGPGQSARAFLTSHNYTKLKIELDYMKGYKPTGQALDSLVAFLNRRLHKNTISRSNIMLTQISDGNQSSYTASDLRNMEAKNRSHFTSGNTLWTYIQVLDGNYSDSSNQNGKVLGLSYYNTSIAIFEKAIRSISGGLGGPPRYKVEGTVIDHEFGHLFGLVNNGTPMVQDHQDTAHGHHCNVKSCLMYYAVETSNTFNNVFNGSIPHIGHYGVADLQANGGK